jgi:hypothetical protein
MLGFIKSIFTNKKLDAPESNQSKEYVEDNIEALFEKELIACPYIKSEYYENVILHLTHKKSLFKTENLLSVEEKKILGLNTRVGFTKEFVAVLTKAGMELQNPKIMLEEIYSKVTIGKSVSDSIQKSLRAGVKKFTLELTGGGDSCEWCVSNTGKEFGTDVLDVVNKNCTCKPYTASYIDPVIKF